MNEVRSDTDASKSAETVRRNIDARWDCFDPDAYFKKNYATLRHDDEQILRLTAEHFAAALSVDQASERRAIDVGAGVNLYPAMAMLPFCQSITLYEYAPPNIEWLRRQRDTAWEDSWNACAKQFWDVLETLPHASIAAPLQQLTDQIEIRPGSIYDLPAKSWDLGTMFFVTESITEDRAQFRQGIDRFLNALKPGAPFVIAFMEHRKRGYHVAGEPFPSTDIGENDIRGYLGSMTQQLVVKHIDVDHTPLDDPYSGMVVACGKIPAPS